MFITLKGSWVTSIEEEDASAEDCSATTDENIDPAADEEIYDVDVPEEERGDDENIQQREEENHYAGVQETSDYCHFECLDEYYDT